MYSLGVIFYRLLTGQMPFRHVTAFELLACTARSDVPPIRSSNPAVPRDLETICLKALEREADDRFRTAQEFADELWRWLHDEPVRSSRPSLWGRVRRWRRRNRAVAAVLTGAAVLLASLGGGMGWALWKQSQSEAEVRGQWKAAQMFGEREVNLRAEVEIRHLLAKARQRLHLLAEGRRLETQAILRQIKGPRGRMAPGAVRDDLDLEARSLFAASFGVPEVETVAEMKCRLPQLRAVYAVIHPDGQSVVLGAPTGPVRWSLGTPSPVLEEFDPRALFPRVAYSPGGKYLLFAPATGGLQVWDETVKHKLADLGPEKGNPVLGMGFDRAGQTLWTCRENGRVEAWSLPECKAIDGGAWTIPAMTDLSAAAFDREATRLAVGDAKGRVLLIRTDGTQPRSLQGPSTDIKALAWSPDGRRVAAGCHTGDVQLWELATGHSDVIPAFDGEIDSLLFHSEGQWLMVGRSGNESKVFDVVTRQLAAIGPVGSIGIAAAGRRLVGTDEKSVTVVEFRPPLGIRRLTGDPFRVSRLAWSRDNRHLVSLDSRFTIRVWDRERGESVAVFHERPTDFFAMNAAVALSDDGRLLAYASGGETRAVGNIREVATGKVCSSWKLRGGYERLACTGDNDFLLVREEMEANKETTRTVAYDLSPGRPIRSSRDLRRSEPGDVRRFYDHGLSRDGRYYWWTGPRLTPQNRRVEVYDVKANMPLLCLPQPTQDKMDEIHSLLSPDGRFLWYWDSLDAINRSSLAQPRSFVVVPLYPLALSPDGLWSITKQPYREPPFNDCLILGRGWHAEKDWLTLGELGGSPQVADNVCFSPNSRYLAWGDDQGTVHIADLRYLEDQVRAFADEILAD